MNPADQPTDQPQPPDMPYLADIGYNITPNTEPAPHEDWQACQKCDGAGYVTEGTKEDWENVTCRECNGSGGRPKSPAPSEALACPESAYAPQDFKGHELGGALATPPTPSGTEAQVCADIAARQQKGIAKYGTTVADNPLSFQQWLTHLYEEMLDAAVYAKRLLATPPAGELSGTPRTDVCESRVVEYDEYIKDKVIGDTVDTDFARQLERELALEFGWHVFQRDRANRLERELAALRQELAAAKEFAEKFRLASKENFEMAGENLIISINRGNALTDLRKQLQAATSANETLRSALERMVELMAEKNDALAICYSDSHTLSLEWLRDKAGPDSIAPKCLENIRKWSDKWQEGGKTLEAASKALAPSAGGEGGGL